MKNIINISILIVIILFLYNNVFTQEYFTIAGDYVNLREKANSKSKVVCQLRLAEDIKFIKKSGIREKIGNIEGEWVYVDSLRFINSMYGETYKGWVLDYFLADISKFQRVKNFKKCNLDGYSGDWHGHYEFAKDGSYKSIINQTTKINGYIYQFRDLIMLKDQQGVNRGVFFIDNNNICLSSRGLNGIPILCGKCE